MTKRKRQGGIIQDLLERYQSASTEYEKAEIENAMWGNASPEARRRVREKKIKRAEWVAEQLRLDRSEAAAIRRRSQLLGHRSAAASLWLRVEKDMTLTTAYTIAIEAKKTRNIQESEEAAVARVLADYDSRPIVRHVGNGKVTRHEKPSSLPKSSTKSSKIKRRKNGGTFWMQLREIIGPYFNKRLEGLDPTIVARERERLEFDLRALFEVTQERIRQVRNDNQDSLSPALARRRFNDGCHVIKIDPPRGPITEGFMKRARTRFRNLAREYHPDRRGDATRPQYEAVIKAWEAIEDYYYQFVKEKKDG